MTTFRFELMERFEALRAQALMLKNAIAEVAGDPIVKAAGPEWPEVTQAALARAERVTNEPPVVRISVVGAFKTGKSTLLNALLGGKFLSENVMPTTAVVTRIVHRANYGATVQMLSKGDLEEGRAALEAALQKHLDTTPPSPDTLPPECEQLLGAYGVLAHGRKSDLDAWNRLVGHFHQTRGLPPLPDENLLGQSIELSATTAAELESRLRPFVAFAGPQSEGVGSKSYLVKGAVIYGPFEVLRPASDGGLTMELADTPGLEDVSELARKNTYKHLEDADCVLLVLGGLGNMSRGDTEVIRFLYRKQSGVRNLIMALTKIDSTMSGVEDPQHYLTRQLPEMIASNRERLRKALADSGLEEEASKQVALQTPILPVCALANLERRQVPRPSHGFAMVRAQWFPTEKEDGFAALGEAIRACLDTAGRLQLLIGAVVHDLEEAAAAPRSWLASMANARSQSGDQLQKELVALEAMTRETLAVIGPRLAKAREDAAGDWNNRLKPVREGFDREVEKISLKLPSLILAFRNSALDDRHWKQLKAIIDRNGRFTVGDFDSILLEQFVSDVFVPSLIPRAKQVLKRMKEEAAGTLTQTSEKSTLEVDSLLRELKVLEGSDASRRIHTGLSERRERGLRQLRSKLDELTERAHGDVDRVFRKIAADTVESWARECSKIHGRGFKGRVSEAFVDVGLAKAQEMPDLVKKGLGPKLDQINQEARGIGLQMFEDSLKDVQVEVERQVKVVREAAEHAKTAEVTRLQAEVKQLRALQERLAAHEEGLSKLRRAQAGVV